MQQTANYTLSKPFSFWLSAHSDQQQQEKQVNYEDLLKKIGTFETSSEFWSFYQYINHPESLPEGSQLFIFQDHIKPAWEDPANHNGGRFIVRVRRAWGNVFWEELLLNFVGDDQQQTNEICGMTMHVKKNFILISIWIKECDDNSDAYEKTQNWIVNTLGFNKQQLEFLYHPRDQEQK